MAVSKIKIFCNNLKLPTFVCHRICCFKKAHFFFTHRNFSCTRYFSIEKNSCTNLSNESMIKYNLQQIPKKNRKLSVIDAKDREFVETIKKGKDPYYPYKGPFDKFTSVLGSGLKIRGSEIIYFLSRIKLNIEEQPFYPTQADIVIIGCNAIGLSVAFAIREKFPDTPNIMIIDKDDTFPHKSTNVGQSMLTQQIFVDEEEIAMSKYAADFLSSFPRLTAVDDQPRFKLPYEPLGSLLLADASNADKLLRKIDVLKKHGITQKILDVKALKNKFPWLKLDDVLFGSLGMSREGMYDPWSFLIGLKCKAINLGVQFLTAEVIDFGVDDFQIPKRVICKLPNGGYHPIDFAYCVLACGIESLNLVEVLNSSNLGPLIIKLPLEERMRYEYCFYSAKGPGLDTPIVIDSDGTYFRREGLCNHYVAGVPCVPYSEEMGFRPYDVFVNKVKPFLEKRVPQFDQIELNKGWIDSYDFCISNEVGVIGPHPDDRKIIFALGFSHLGLQYAPAVGRAIMEYIMYDDYKEIDLSRYHVENLWQKQHLEAESKKEKLMEPQERIRISD